MSHTTITEALSSIKVTASRFSKKVTFVTSNLLRSSKLVDPLAKQGGSDVLILSEIQSIEGLCSNILETRRAIRQANETTLLMIEGEERSLADWLTWRRDVYPQLRDLYEQMEITIRRARATSEVRRGGSQEQSEPQDIVVHYDEAKLHKTLEKLNIIHETLDGKLSLMNALTTVEVRE